MNLDPAITHVFKEMWPLNNPDLNRIDYWSWGANKVYNNRRAHAVKTSLIAIVKENFASLDMDIVIMACGWFRGRVEAVIEASGDFTE